MMNKYQEAITYLEPYLPSNALFEKENRTAEALKVLKELVDRATPEEPIYEGDGYIDGEIAYDTALCPNCDAYFEEGDFIWEKPYCPSCGQALDWGESND